MKLNIVSKRMRVFAKVAQLLSFTKAADALSMTQPAVTLQIKALEGEIGADVFCRANNTIKLTKAGETLLCEIEKVLNFEIEVGADIAAMIESCKAEAEKWKISPFAPNPVANQEGWWWWNGEKKTEEGLLRMGMKQMDGGCWMQKESADAW